MSRRRAIYPGSFDPVTNGHDGNGLHGAQWLSYEDHRMATAGAIIGLRVPGIQVENIATTAKTMPNFTELWAGMLEGAEANEPGAAQVEGGKTA
jgi:hypothetical protein